jgi:CheY-like chemotaxis protein
MVSERENRAIVLYVDDVQANLMLFEASFGSFYEVILAESGKEALEILEKQDVHVLVSDQNMPGMTGNELLEKVSATYPDVMRFMITAYTDYDVVVDVINRGDPYGFFNKPYNRDDVRKAIDRSLEVRNLRIRNREMIGKLEKANEMMLGLDRSKTNFLLSVTEEIRNPINKIMTAVHMIKDKIDSSELAELLSLLDVSVRKLESFSESTKHIARLYNPLFSLEKSPVSLKEIIDIGVIEKGNIITSKNISIKYDENSVEGNVLGEYDLLQSLFASLFGFVIDHTTEGSGIQLAIDKSSDGTLLKILSGSNTFTEKQKEDLRSFSIDKESFIDRDFIMELFLVGEILKAHQGRLTFTEAGDKSEICLLFLE